MKRISAENGKRITKQIFFASLVFCLFVPSCILASAESNLTGTWVSKYQFGPIEEVMTANIQQVEENALGSFKVEPSSGEEYSGIIFGTIDGDRIRANYLTVRASESKDPLTIITFVDARITDQDTIKGTYYAQDSDMNSVSGPFEADRTK